MDIEISTDRDRLDIDMIHRFLSEESYWSPRIARELVERGIANSLPFGVYLGDRQVGFARVVTDYSRFGYLADVFILSEFRGRGYSKVLVQTILDYPALESVSRMLLFTRDAHMLYHQFGFEILDDPRRIMVWLRPNRSSPIP